MRDEELIAIIADHHGLDPEQVRAHYQDEIELCRAVAEREREECAKLVESQEPEYGIDEWFFNRAMSRLAAAIRARGRVGG